MTPLISPPPFPPWRGDPFSEWLLSLVGWEYPLREDQQALVVSLLGIALMLASVYMLLLFTVGITAACEDVLALLRGECCLMWARFRSSGKGTFVLIDEGTDVQAAAIAAAELADGAPRGVPPDDDESGYSSSPNRSASFRPIETTTEFLQSETLRGAALTGRALPDPLPPQGAPDAASPTIQSRFGTSDGPRALISAPAASRGAPPLAQLQGSPTASDRGAPLNAPRRERGLAPSQHLALGSALPSNSGACTSRGMVSGRIGSPTPQLSTRAMTARVSLVADQTVRSADNSREAGWKDKGNPSWYGV